MCKSVCLLSGGMDSLVTLAVALQEGREVYPLFIDYGQKSKVQEAKAFDAICSHYRLMSRSKKISLPCLKEIAQSALLSNSGGDTSTQVDIKHLKETTENYVPFRNALLLSLATAYAETIGAEYIYAGNEPNNMNPDNSAEFISAMQTVILIGTKKNVHIRLVTPLIRTNGKKDIIEIGEKLHAPFELSWSCYDAKAIQQGMPCGVCEKCQFRKEAFASLGKLDPVPYQRP